MAKSRYTEGFQQNLKRIKKSKKGINTMTSSTRMIVTDLDRTLLRDDKTISEYTKETIKQVMGSGILFVVATARPIRAVVHWLPYVKYDIGIFHNGAVIVEKDGTATHFGIPDADKFVRRVLEGEPESNIAVEFNDTICANFDADRIWENLEFTFTSDFTEIAGVTADKVLIEAGSLQEMEKHQKYLDDEMYLQLSENTVAMVMNKAATKLNGIRFLASRYGIDMKDIVAFGDDYNDIEMLKACGTGIAVENALGEAKEAADGICGSNEDDGVARWIKSHCLPVSPPFFSENHK